MSSSCLFDKLTFNSQSDIIMKIKNGDDTMKLGLRRGTVSVEPHNREWEINANNIIAKLNNILCGTITDAQHIGSTAVKHIYAKPIIDIIIGVSDFDKLLAM